MTSHPLLRTSYCSEHEPEASDTSTKDEYTIELEGNFEGNFSYDNNSPVHARLERIDLGKDVKTVPGGQPVLCLVPKYWKPESSLACSPI